jgi:hypothetical protein
MRIFNFVPRLIVDMRQKRGPESSNVVVTLRRSLTAGLAGGWLAIEKTPSSQLGKPSELTLCFDPLFISEGEAVLMTVAFPANRTVFIEQRPGLCERIVSERELRLKKPEGESVDDHKPL